MERYREYKESGVKWLGEIPSHWEVKRLANFFSERREKVSDQDYAPLSVTKQGIFPQLDNVAKTNDGDNRKLVKRGDFVINSRSDRKGSSGVSELDGSVSLINLVLQPRKTLFGPFCNYLLKSYGFIEENYRNGRGIVADLWTTRYDEMKMIKVALPSLEEQKTISSYLDSATSEIDKAIAMQQKMIDLLNERKQIIIQNAVTKGLDENVEMKESGVEWIGRIPKHWEVVPLKYTGAFGNGLTYSPIEIVDDGVLVIRSSNIQNSKLVFDDNVFVEIIPQNLMVKKGDIIICSRNGSADLVGKCAIVEENINATFGAFMMRYTPNINPKYAFFLFQTAIRSYKGYFSTSTINQLTKTIIGEMKVPVAGISEQQQIAAYLDVEMQRFDSAITNCQRQITLLQERKQIIINEVVTGKVRVS